MVSVIIPIYNAKKHLQTILNCLLRQTVDDFEVLLIDDGSIDESGIVCDEFASTYPRFRVIHQKNQGVSIARNRGIAEAKGEFVLFLDADDEIPYNYIEVLMQTQKATKAEIVVCDVVMIKQGKEVRRYTCDDTVVSSSQALEYLLTRKGINSGPCAKLISSFIIGDIAFDNLKVYEDILFIKEAFDRANIIAITNKTEYRYIQNNDSAMHNLFKNPTKDIIIATDKLACFIENRSDLSPYCMYITISHLFQYVQLVLNDSDIDGKEFILESRTLIHNHILSILKCSAFPWKEKVLYLLFSIGILDIIIKNKL